MVTATGSAPAVIVHTFASAIVAIHKPDHHQLFATAVPHCIVATADSTIHLLTITLGPVPSVVVLDTLALPANNGGVLRVESLQRNLHVTCQFALYVFPMPATLGLPVRDTAIVAAADLGETLGGGVMTANGVDGRLVAVLGLNNAQGKCKGEENVVGGRIEGEIKGGDGCSLEG